MNEQEILDRAKRAAMSVDELDQPYDALLRRRDRKRRNQRIAAGVVGIAIFVAAVWIVTTAGSFHNAQTPAVPGDSPSPPPPGVDLQELERTVGGVTFSFNVPITHGTPFESNWEPKAGISINKSIVGPQGAEAMFFWTSFSDDKRTDPCAGLPSATDLAAAVATAPGTELVEGPSDVTVGGNLAKYVVLTVRENLGCAPGFFYTWDDPAGGALFPSTTVGDTIRVWIVHVDGTRTRLFLEAVTTEQADFDLEQEIEQIVGSIRFVDTPTPGASGSTGPSDTGVSAPKVPKPDYLFDLDTGEKTPLPESIVGTEDLTAGYAVSPDGSEVAYYGGADGGAQVFVANLNGTHVRQITSNGSARLIWSGSPGWSPDGTKIAYIGHVHGGVSRKGFVIDLASGVTTQVTFETREVEGIQFSPDGSSILYTTSELPNGGGTRAIRIVPVTGGEASTLETGTRTSDSWPIPADAQLSPDGSLLSFICAPGPDLCLANADGSDTRVLASADDAIMSARWSPDGTRVAYWVFHSLDVWVMDVATGVASHVTQGAQPVWLDDHTLIVQQDRCPGPQSTGCGG